MIFGGSIFVIVIVAIVAGMISSIARSALSYKYRAQRPAGDPEPQRRLEESVLELTDQVAQLRNEVVDLGERMDFAERVLVRGREEGRLPEKH